MGSAERSLFHPRQTSSVSGTRDAEKHQPTFVRLLVSRIEFSNLAPSQEILAQIHAGVHAGNLVAVTIEHADVGIRFW